MSVAEALVLIRQLPPESLFFCAMHKLQGTPWTSTDHFLAGVIDALNVNTFATIKVGGGKPKKPQLITRPGRKTNKGGGLFASMARAAHFKGTKQ